MRISILRPRPLWTAGLASSSFFSSSPALPCCCSDSWRRPLSSLWPIRAYCFFSAPATWLRRAASSCPAWEPNWAWVISECFCPACSRREVSWDRGSNTCKSGNLMDKPPHPSSGSCYPTMPISKRDSFPRRRLRALVWSWEIRDSETSSTLPISFKVSSS